MYGGAKDNNLDGIHDNTSNLQNGVNLYDLILQPFKGKGRCVTMDSAYMSDIMAQIGRYEWCMYMVGTARVNCTGADAKSTDDAMPVTMKGTNKSAMWQLNTLQLIFAAWVDNAIVKSFSNFHSHAIIQDGVQCWCKMDGVRQRDLVGVPVLEKGKIIVRCSIRLIKGMVWKQNMTWWEYVSIIRLISIQLYCIITLQYHLLFIYFSYIPYICSFFISKSHEWAPKLSC